MLLYHQVPKGLRGTTLYPLNLLKDVYPSAHAHEAVKYTGREAVMQQTIPIFDCPWNDVLFFSPVHPEKIVQARTAYGLKEDHNKNIPFFVLNSEDLDQSKLLLYRHRPKWLIDQEQDKAEYVSLTEISSLEKNHLTEMPACALWSIEKFRERALFQGYIPHILYKGTVDVARASTVMC